MATHSEVAERFAKRGKPIRGTHVFMDGDIIYSWGRHFPMAVAIDENKLFVINGDVFSSSTSTHQGYVRSAIRRNDNYENITLPYSAVDLAVRSFTGRQINSYPLLFKGLKIIDVGREIDKFGCDACGDLTPIEWDNHPKVGHHRWSRHLLAPSVFSLTVDWYEQVPTGERDEQGYAFVRDEPRRTVAYFLSGFDETARAWNGGYFLSRLPKKPRDIAHAFEMLKPEPVKRAIARGIKVRRQGDIFYVPDEKMTTRKLNKKGLRLPEMHMKPLIGWQDEILGYEKTDIVENPNESTWIRGNRRPRLLETNHYATEAFKVNGSTYARGSLYHRPGMREADHRTIRLGKGWGKIHRNTALGSWSAAGGYGRVD